MSYDDAKFLELTAEGILVDFEGVLVLSQDWDMLRSRLKLELQNAFIAGREASQKLRAKIAELEMRVEVLHKRNAALYKHVDLAKLPSGIIDG